MSTGNLINQRQTVGTPSEVAQRITNARPGGVSPDDNLTLPQLENEIAQKRASLEADIALIKKQAKNGGVNGGEVEQIIQIRTKKVQDKIKELEELRSKIVELSGFRQDTSWELRNDALTNINKAITSELPNLNIYDSWVSSLSA